jgi:hypothetical protein
MISQIFLAFENYSFVGYQKEGFIDESIYPIGPTSMPNEGTL